MQSLSILALLASVSGTLARPSAEELTSCITSNAADLASYSDCADPEILTHCLSTLDAPAKEYIASCHLEAGCPSASAETDSNYLLARCHGILSGADLRKRYAEMPMVARADIGPNQSGNDCMTTSTVSTKVCVTETNDGKAVATCRDTSVAQSKCKPGKTCSMDGNGTNVCMDLKNSLDVAGIIIAIVFASLITIGIGTLTFLCCKDRKEQKRLQAKAEATALARAATKKKRAAEVRQPLMAQSQAPGPDTSALGGGAPDPFHDGNRP